MIPRLPLFALPFELLASVKGNGSRLISLFTLPFRLIPAWKGNMIPRLPLFALPFRLLAGGKGNPTCLISLFALPFELLAGGKGNPTCLISLFALPFRHPARCQVPRFHQKTGRLRRPVKPNSVSFPIFHTISSSGGSFRTAPYQRHLSSCATASCIQGSKAC